MDVMLIVVTWKNINCVLKHAEGIVSSTEKIFWIIVNSCFSSHRNSINVAKSPRIKSDLNCRYKWKHCVSKRFTKFHWFFRLTSNFSSDQTFQEMCLAVDVICFVNWRMWLKNEKVRLQIFKVCEHHFQVVDYLISL